MIIFMQERVSVMKKMLMLRMIMLMIPHHRTKCTNTNDHHTQAPTFFRRHKHIMTHTHITVYDRTITSSVTFTYASRSCASSVCRTSFCFSCFNVSMICLLRDVDEPSPLTTAAVPVLLPVILEVVEEAEAMSVVAVTAEVSDRKCFSLLSKWSLCCSRRHASTHV
jgi:hypothetical protein